MTVPHAVTVNGRTSFELKPRPGDGSVYDQLSMSLSLLDGKERSAFLLWRLPDGVPFDEVDSDSEPEEYIQCAGGLSGRFTCEVRRLGPHGGTSHEVIGRRERARFRRRRSEFIEGAEKGTPVQRNEVLDLDEVVELFESYLASGAIPSSYTARALSL